MHAHTSHTLVVTDMHERTHMHTHSHTRTSHTCVSTMHLSAHSVSVRFEPRKDEDRVRDPLPHNNDEQLRRRLATEEVICKVCEV